MKPITKAEKKDQEPIKYFKVATISCACGQIFKTGATVEKIEVDICSNCHPFYTGEGRLIDTRGRVERFKRLVQKSKKPSKINHGKVGFRN